MFYNLTIIITLNQPFYKNFFFLIFIDVYLLLNEYLISIGQISNLKKRLKQLYSNYYRGAVLDV